MSKKKSSPDAPRILRRKKLDPYAAAAKRRYVFAALPLSMEVKRAIADHVRPIRDQMRSFAWLHPSQWQIVVKHFGEMEKSDAERLGNRIQTVISGAIPVEFRGVGANPDVREAQSLWVGIRDSKSGLKNLHRDINDACSSLGFEVEAKRFRPQLAVAHLEQDQRPRPVARELSPVMDVLMDNAVLDELILYRTEMGRDGLVSVPFRRFALGSL